MKRLLVTIINFYQIFLSLDTGILKMLTPGGACKYPLRCSEYTKQAITQFGVVKGLGKGVRRLVSCR